MSGALAPGFANPVFDGQAVFRAVLSALSRPGLPAPAPTGLTPPPRLPPELAAVALALADPDAPLWLDAPLAASPEVTGYLRFHTGARIVGNPAEAAFALVADPLGMPDLGGFALGTDEYPDRSTTVVLAVRSLADGPAMTLVGPGVKDVVTVRASPLPRGFATALRNNAAWFPRGLDFLLVAPRAVLAIPRSSRVVGEVV